MGIYLLVALLLGIVFLMTVKPGLGGSLLTIGVARILGLGFSLLKMKIEISFAMRRYLSSLSQMRFPMIDKINSSRAVMF